jgi:hypothetical protein
MNKPLITISLTSLLGFSSFWTGAETLECLVAPSREKPCNNLVYRAVTDPKTNKNMMFCFCRQDFDRLLKTDVTDEEFVFNKMEWRQILAETGYSEKQLKSMIKR